jgi:N-acetylmuramoyl-L-alanine amidase-like protein
VLLALSAAPRADLALLAAALRDAPAGGARAEQATRALLGARYLLSPLGEGAGRDPDPRFRLDAFDCMTFVETAIALGSAATLDEAPALLDDVRYDGAIDWAHRNHEVLSQWIPANVRKGWVADVAADVAGTRTRVAGTTFTHGRWARLESTGRAIPAIPRALRPVGRFTLGVVAPVDIPAIAARIPTGAILVVVREDLSDHVTRVTHLGLAVRGPRGEVFVRHASSSAGSRRVLEEPIGRFLERQARAYRWPITGLGILAVRDNRARAAALLGPQPEVAGAAAPPAPVGAEPAPAPPATGPPGGEPPPSPPPRM